MGWFDDMVGKVRRRAQEEAARYVAKKAKDSARKTVDEVTGGILGRAEQEREEARQRREAEARQKQEAAAAIEARRKAREAREQQAREDVERLKREAMDER